MNKIKVNNFSKELKTATLDVMGTFVNANDSWVNHVKNGYSKKELIIDVQKLSQQLLETINLPSTDDKKYDTIYIKYKEMEFYFIVYSLVKLKDSLETKDKISYFSIEDFVEMREEIIHQIKKMNKSRN